jgi:hypothetical protein
LHVFNARTAGSELSAIERSNRGYDPGELSLQSFPMLNTPEEFFYDHPLNLRFFLIILKRALSGALPVSGVESIC